MTAWLVAVGLLATCLGVTAVGALAARGRLEPGHVLGLRTAATMASEEAWHVGNEVAGAHVLLVGAGGLVASLGTAAVTAVGAGDGVVVLFAAVIVLVTVAGVVAGGVRGHDAARAVVEDERG